MRPTSRSIARGKSNFKLVEFGPLRFRSLFIRYGEKLLQAPMRGHPLRSVHDRMSHAPHVDSVSATFKDVGRGPRIFASLQRENCPELCQLPWARNLGAALLCLLPSPSACHDPPFRASRTRASAAATSLRLAPCILPRLSRTSSKATRACCSIQRSPRRTRTPGAKMVNSFLAIVALESTECEEDYLAVKLGAGGARTQPLGEDLGEACGDYELQRV